MAYSIEGLYSIDEIAEMFKMGSATIHKRIEMLGVEPDGMVNRSRFFSKEKADCIGTYRKYKPVETFMIYESKMNFK